MMSKQQIGLIKPFSYNEAAFILLASNRVNLNKQYNVYPWKVNDDGNSRCGFVFHLWNR